MSRGIPKGRLWQRGPLAMDPALDDLRVSASSKCWWCGAPATTEEHRIKASTLRRVARASGAEVPSNVYKRSDDWDGLLRSLNKGSQVRWRKNMCASCNNARSQPFDEAYDVVEAFIVKNVDAMEHYREIHWCDVYGRDWRPGAENLGRYFGKQLGCMLATQQLPIPMDLISFLNGGRRCPSIQFFLRQNWRAMELHREMRAAGSTEGITTFVGLLDSVAYHTDGAFSGVDYGYHIGHLWFCVAWREGCDSLSWWEYPVVQVPEVYGTDAERAEWRAFRRADH